MSGMSNVVHWLHEHGFDPDPHLAEAILRVAKESNRVLTDEELLQVCKFETRAKDEPLPLDTLDEWKKEVSS
jgi:hypothetical protein